MKIGILKEGKTPIDRRVAFTPTQCIEIVNKYSNIQIVVQSSNIRSYSDQEYIDCGIALQEDLSDCDVLFGVKEVPIDQLIPDKSYFFFSHTIKKQSYNQPLLKALVEKNITFFDYECLTNNAGIRVVAFGRFAGLVGAYNGLRAFGLKKNLFKLKPAYQCVNQLELFAELNKIKGTTKDLKILLTGGGRVAKGAIEILQEAGFPSVDVEEYKHYHGNCFLQLDAYDYNSHKDDNEFSYDDFFANPHNYVGNFEQFIPYTKLFIAGAYWDPKAPVLFDLKDIQDKAFKIEVIADITCDIKGSVPTTFRSTTIEDPLFDINKSTLEEEKAFSNPDNITVMSVDNLPCELPRDASESFGSQLFDNVIPVLAGKKDSDILEKACICTNKLLTEKFSYLQDYLEGLA